MYQENESMQLEDGRTLSYAIYGSPMPRQTIVYLHGFPSSRYEGKLWHSSCATRNVRLIAPDRPGSGLSGFQVKRRILDFPSDVLALTEHLKIHQFYILGLSGGAPYVLACVKKIAKDRLLGATVVSGLYPAEFGSARTMLSSRIILWVAPWTPGLTATLLDSMMGKASRDNDPKLLEAIMSREIDDGHPGDQKVIKGPQNWPTFVAMTRESFQQGSEGASWEAKLHGSDWGFSLAQLSVGDQGVPLTLWHGLDDRNCPATMAQQAKDFMPGSVLRLKEGEGHVSFIFRDAQEILDDLLGQAEIEEYIIPAIL
ncbi:MhpC hydrolase or acyltransferase alpha beta hydrolase superfamily [Pyrenophora tritici-repentis]|uniref:Alpha/beta hydrolase fold n=2 Tax=Pyrenophora tritici-repentis TaxID=45151 RepID=A0A2W1DUR9_9PLEO|nr:alpha/beta hydrolase fold domain containing protein [Pyrenophora tritici-repentis Pt-1C-BFP]KAA8615335.1 Alpha/beta hydrolase fold domain-containing protein [Pyrenophora tritici-repentis]EDU46020.1 alpha/beta hydrolase fold domain containing protein [Pyrenophora tritici-repentis Pt-1C-BFP]KAF7444084.1 Alpha/beta hydrolase fold domain containing protein [Pyrenophora tritici-repentis]KAF7566176.1 MhpC, hydrolase or acyltransferase (alpha-beta hydrolase superfamily) [Pyrenophora tritici-repenti